MKSKVLFFLIGLCLLALPVWAQTTLLHEFSGESGDGMLPSGSLILSGSTLYGMTPYGGDSNYGTIFKEQTDGTGYTILHSFDGSFNDGSKPFGSLILSGTTLYGMTLLGGVNDSGTIFKIETDGSDFALLHSFIGGANDGSEPQGSLVIQGTTLYGMTMLGGTNDMGTIFRIETDSSGFTLLRSFSDDTNDGRYPYGSLIVDGEMLYGMTRFGGTNANHLGTIFKIGTDGTGFTLLHSFTGYSSDGSEPMDALTLSGTTLFGVAPKGGSTYNAGVIFKVETDGSGYTLLHSFGGGADNGSYPYGSPVIYNSTLYGMTYAGGTNGTGTVFKIGTSGSGFSLLHSFIVGTEDGFNPQGSLIFSGTTLYGLTSRGGYYDHGVLFSFQQTIISMTFPNGGEIWAVGENHDITWTSTGTVGDINIDYSTDDGGNWISLAAGTENDGSYSWSVPNTPSTTCLVRVSSTTSPTIADSSDASFAISAPFVAVTSPNGGEVWQRGTTQTITWISAGVANIKIQLLKGTALYSTITPSTPATGGSFSWIIPASQPVAANYKVRIISTASSAMADSSDANFAIFAPAITVTAPAASASWLRGVPHTITWTTTGTMDSNVKIQLYKGTTKKLDIILSTENDGAYDWLIPSGLALGKYTIRITTLDNKVKDNSGVFSIVAGIITVNAPVSGSSWQRGTLHTITWTGEGTLTATVKIQLFRGTRLVATLAAAAPNNGSFDWATPAAQALASNYKICVSTVNNLVKGTSGAFAITTPAGIAL